MKALILAAGRGTRVQRFEPHVHRARSIVQAHTRLGRDTSFSDKLVGAGYCVSAQGEVLDHRHTDTRWLFQDARSIVGPLTDAQRRVLAATAAPCRSFAGVAQ